VQNGYVRLLDAFVNELDLSQATSEELTSSSSHVPPLWSDVSLRSEPDAVTGWLGSVVRSEFEVEPEEILVVRKFGRGGRPYSILGLKERVLYRSAVDRIKFYSDTSLNRGAEEYSKFVNGPSEEATCKYVLKLDIAAYYQYVDHERLVDEVVSQTGDDLAIGAAVEILQRSSARRFGLPQMNTASDFLGELYIGPMHREIERLGFPTWRYADDFRIACRGYGEALKALEAADHAAREMGLVLNEAKTSIQRIDRYNAGLNLIRQRESDLLTSIDVDSFFLDYDELVGLGGLALPAVDDSLDLTSGSVDEVRLLHAFAAKSVLTQWVEEDEDDEIQRREEAHVTALLLKKSLRILGALKDPAALEHATAMLVHEPSLTPTICRYLRNLTAEESSRVAEVMDEVCSRNVLSQWQSLWIAFVAGHLPPRPKGAHESWLLQQLATGCPSVAAESLLSLCRRKLIDKTSALSAIDRQSELHRATGLVALAALHEPGLARSQAASALDRLRISWAEAAFE
jgi:Reverse transcriptase (RNA-dependent DNA polymerase)